MRKYSLILSLSSLFLMIVFYLIGQLDTANWFGSLGFGLLVITVIFYLPELFKKGYINKL